MTDHPSALVSVPVEVMARIAALLEDPKAEHPHDASYLIEDVRALAAAPAAPQAAGEVEKSLGQRAYEKMRDHNDNASRTMNSTVQWSELSEDERQRWDDDATSQPHLYALRAPSREPEGGAVECILDRLNYENVRYMSRVGGLSEWIVRFKSDIRSAIATREDAQLVQWGWRVRSKPSKTPSHRPWHWQADEPTGTTEELCEWEPVYVSLATRKEAPAEAGERSVMVCPRCEGEGEYADGVDEAACSTPCTRCNGNGWLVDLEALRAQPQAREDAQPVRCPRCDRGEVFGLSMDDGSWVEFSSAAGGSHPAGMHGWLELAEHHPDGRVVLREYVAKDSPIYPEPDAMRAVVEALTDAELALSLILSPSDPETKAGDMVRGEQARQSCEDKFATLQAEQGAK